MIGVNRAPGGLDTSPDRGVPLADAHAGLTRNMPTEAAPIADVPGGLEHGPLRGYVAGGDPCPGWLERFDAGLTRNVSTDAAPIRDVPGVMCRTAVAWLVVGPFRPT